MTHVPLPGSPAIDTAAPSCLATDQRGVVRPKDGNGDGTVRCDVGAAEFDPAAWNYYTFQARDGIFAVNFDAVPHQNRMNGVTGVARGVVNSADDLAVIVRFNPAGRIDARNDGFYQADSVINYTAGKRYHFRLVINVPQHTYDVFVQPPGGVEQALATNYAFRTSQQSVQDLDAWALRGLQGSHTVTNFNLGF
jgi:hypothetical protein